MSRDEVKRYACLIFIESYKKEGDNKVPISIDSARVYGLVAETQINFIQECFNHFARKQIILKNNDQDPAAFQDLPNRTFYVFDFEFVDDSTYRSQHPDNPIHAQVDEINKDIMKSMLGRIRYNWCEDSVRDRDKPRFSTIIQENMGFIENCLNHGGELIYRRGNGETFLHFAARTDSESLVNALLRYNYEVDAKRFDGFTPLHIAAKRGHLEICNLLIRHGAIIIPPVENFKGLTPLMLASKKGHLDVVRFLIDISSGSDINALRSDGRSALHMAAWGCFPDVVELLVEHGADVTVKSGKSYSNSTPLALAIRGNPKAIDILLNAGSDVNATCENRDGKEVSVLSEALTRNLYNRIDLEIVRLILAHNPDPNNLFNKRAFYKAVRACDAKNNERCVKMLCEYGFTADAQSLAAFDEAETLMILFGAILKKSHSVVEVIVKTRNIVNLAGKPSLAVFQFNCTSLHVAATTGDEALLKILLDNGADINAVDGDGKKPLFYAVTVCNENAVKFLIANQAEIENQPELLFAAIYQGNSNIIETLLHNGAGVDGIYNGETLTLPLRITTRPDPQRAPVSSNATMPFGSQPELRLTPICSAASLGETQIVKVLLKFGADPHILRFNRSPLNKAVNRRRSETLRLLLDDLFLNRDCRSEILAQHSIRRINTNVEFANRVAEFIIKRNCVGFPECNIDTLSSYWTFPHTMEEYQNRCEAEVALLQTDRISDTDVSYYDILMKDVNTISCFMRNDIVVQAFKSSEFKEKFPIFGGILDLQFERGYHRRFLLTRGNTVCCTLIKQFNDLPDNLKEQILNHLNNHELQYLSSSSRTLIKEEL